VISEIFVLARRSGMCLRAHTHIAKRLVSSRAVKARISGRCAVPLNLRVSGLDPRRRPPC